MAVISGAALLRFPGFPVLSQITPRAGIGKQCPIKVVAENSGDGNQRQLVQRDAKLFRGNDGNSGQQRNGKDDPVAQPLVTDLVK